MNFATRESSSHGTADGARPAERELVVRSTLRAVRVLEEHDLVVGVEGLGVAEPRADAVIFEAGPGVVEDPDMTPAGQRPIVHSVVDVVGQAIAVHVAQRDGFLGLADLEVVEDVGGLVLIQDASLTCLDAGARHVRLLRIVGEVQDRNRPEIRRAVRLRAEVAGAVAAKHLERGGWVLAVVVEEDAPLEHSIQEAVAVDVDEAVPR